MIMGKVYKLDFTKNCDITLAEIDVMINDINIKLSRIKHNKSRKQTYNALNTIKDSLLSAKVILNCEMQISSF